MPIDDVDGLPFEASRDKKAAEPVDVDGRLLDSVDGLPVNPDHNMTGLY